MGIPTAAYQPFESDGACPRLRRGRGAPMVVKADGLAAGKGVTVADELQEAEDFIRDCFGGAFGASGTTIVIEDFLEGEEASFFALCDGETSSCSPRRRTTSASGTATRARIPAAWVPIPRRR